MEAWSLMEINNTKNIKNNNNTSNEISGTDIWKELRVGLAVYYCFVLVASITCNTILITIIVKLKKVHTLSHLFVMNLSASNLLTSLIFLPFDVDTNLRGGYFPHGKFVCGVYKLFFLLSLPLSTINLLLLTADTFVTIAYPYKRDRVVTKRNVTACLIATYTYAVLCTAFPVLRLQGDSVSVEPSCRVDMSLEYMYVYVSVNLFVPVVIIVVLNVIMLTIANDHGKQISNFVQRYHMGQKKTNTTAATAITTTTNESSPSSPSSPFSSSSGIGFPSMGSSLPTTEDLSPTISLRCAVMENQATNNIAKGTPIKQSKSTPNFSSSSSSCEGNRSTNSLNHRALETSSSVTSRVGFLGCGGGLSTSFVLNVKAAKRVAILVGECLFCWLFYIVVLFVNISYHYDPVVTRIANVINYSSFFLNPLVYGLCNPKIRRYVMRIFFRNQSSRLWSMQSENKKLCGANLL